MYLNGTTSSTWCPGGSGNSVTFFAACELGQKPNETQVAILLHTAGPEAQEIHQTLVYANDDERKDYNAVLGKLRAYCEPRKNVVFERHRFWSRDQLEHETIGQWTTELRTRAANCEFQESDNMIRDNIVFGIRDRPVQEKLHCNLSSFNFF